MKFLPFLVHEYAHWLDHCSTIWGRRLLIHLYEAMNARQNNIETELKRIPMVRSALHGATQVRYYTIIADLDQIFTQQSVLAVSYTAGIQYDSQGVPNPTRPILFARFARVLPTGEQRFAGRIPFTNLALTEAHAVAASVACELEVLKGVSDAERASQTAGLRARLLAMLNDPALAIYAVGAHAVANAINTRDPIEAYRVAGALARICLNLPDDVLDKLRAPKDFVGNERVPFFKARRDRGFAFYAIANNGRATSYQNAEQWIDAALTRSGLPPAAAIEQQAGAQMARAGRGHYRGPLSDRLDQLLELGAANFSKTGLRIDETLLIDCVTGSRDDLVLPPMILGDGELYCPSQGLMPIGFPNYEAWVFSARDREADIVEFLDACLP